jgi:hypothetical protein
LRSVGEGERRGGEEKKHVSATRRRGRRESDDKLTWNLNITPKKSATLLQKLAALLLYSSTLSLAAAISPTAVSLVERSAL